MCAGEPLELWVGAGLPSPIIGSSPLAARYMSDDATRCDRGSYTGVLQATYATRRAGICEFSRGRHGGAGRAPRASFLRLFISTRPRGCLQFPEDAEVHD